MRHSNQANRLMRFPHDIDRLMKLTFSVSLLILLIAGGISLDNELKSVFFSSSFLVENSRNKIMDELFSKKKKKKLPLSLWVKLNAEKLVSRIK